MRAALSQMKLIPWFERGPTTESLCQVSKPLFAPMLCGAMWFPAWRPRAYFPPVPVEACVPRPTHQNPIFTFLYCRFQAPRMQTKEAASVCSLCAIRLWHCISLLQYRGVTHLNFDCVRYTSQLIGVHETICLLKLPCYCIIFGQPTI